MKKRSNHPAIRELLRQHADGLTINQIRMALGIDRVDVVRNALLAMPDTWIDRWTTPVRGQYQAVWCVARIPADCPYPTTKD